MMDGDADSSNYDGRKYPECAPYLGQKGQQWNTFVRDFVSAMSMREVSDDSLEDCLYGIDTGGDRWLTERQPGALDANNVNQQGALVRPQEERRLYKLGSMSSGASISSATRTSTLRTRGCARSAPDDLHQRLV